MGTVTEARWSLFRIEQWSSKHGTQMHSISITWEVTEMEILKPHMRTTESKSGGGTQ